MHFETTSEIVCINRRKKRGVMGKLSFKSDHIGSSTRRQRPSLVEKVNRTVNLYVGYANLPMIPRGLEDGVPQPIKFMCMNRFTCSWRAEYIGRIMCKLARRIKEHSPLLHGEQKVIACLIASHVVDFGQNDNISIAFEMLHQHLCKYSKTHLFLELCASEGVRIGILRPKLCVQIYLVHQVTFLWPSLPINRNELTSPMTVARRVCPFMRGYACDRCLIVCRVEWLWNGVCLCVRLGCFVAIDFVWLWPWYCDQLSVEPIVLWLSYLDVQN